MYIHFALATVSTGYLFNFITLYIDLSGVPLTIMCCVLYFMKIICWQYKHMYEKHLSVNTFMS